MAASVYEMEIFDGEVKPWTNGPYSFLYDAKNFRERRFSTFNTKGNSVHG